MHILPCLLHHFHLNNLGYKAIYTQNLSKLANLNFLKQVMQLVQNLPYIRQLDGINHILQTHYIASTGCIKSALQKNTNLQEQSLFIAKLSFLDEGFIDARDNTNSSCVALRMDEGVSSPHPSFPPFLHPLADCLFGSSSIQSPSQ